MKTVQKVTESVKMRLKQLMNMNVIRNRQQLAAEIKRQPVTVNEEDTETSILIHLTMRMNLQLLQPKSQILDQSLILDLSKCMFSCLKSSDMAVELAMCGWKRQPLRETVSQTLAAIMFRTYDRNTCEHLLHYLLCNDPFISDMAADVFCMMCSMSHRLLINCIVPLVEMQTTTQFPPLHAQTIPKVLKQLIDALLEANDSCDNIVTRFDLPAYRMGPEEWSQSLHQLIYFLVECQNSCLRN